MFWNLPPLRRFALLFGAWCLAAFGVAAAEPAIPGQVLIKVGAAGGLQPMATLRLPAGARVSHGFGTRGWRLVELAPDMTVAEGVRWFRDQPGVQAAEPNHRYTLHDAGPAGSAGTGALPDDPEVSRLYGMERIGAPSVWASNTGSTNVVVAVLDTGLNLLHPDIAANLWTNPGEIPGNGVDDDENRWIDDVHGVDVVARDGDPEDEAGHGTHVAGTIGAVGNNGHGVAGVCWKVSLLPVRVGRVDGFGTTVELVAAFDYVVALRKRGVNVRVINCSWGGGFPSDSLREAVQAAAEADILVVCSAGNDRQDNDVQPTYPATYDSPALLSVAASTACDEPSSFSNYGERTVHLAAPGSGILSTYRGTNRYAVLSGTSMASPHVSGAAALILAQKPGLTAAAVRSLILANVDVLPSWSRRVTSGGRLNVARALAAASVVPLPPPPAVVSPRLTLVSRPGTRSQANNESDNAVISEDGAWIAFASRASNLVTGDTEGFKDVFLVERATRTVVRVSQSLAGVGGNGHSHLPAISADGRFVAFQSDASDLAVGDANGTPDIYVWNRDTRRIELVSVRQDGRGAGNRASGAPAISADGNWVAFQSAASNLVGSDSNESWDVFVRDRFSKITERVSVTRTGAQANGSSGFPSISADGTLIAFESSANNLVSDDRNGSTDVFVRDRTAKSTERVSVRSGGAGEGRDESWYPRLSANGRFVIFSSLADELDGAPSDPFVGAMVFDRQTRLQTRLSRGTASGVIAGNAFGESLSSDGRYAIFLADDVGLAPGGAPGFLRCFVHDRLTGTVGLLDANQAGYCSENNSYEPRCSGDGRWVVFFSFGSNLTPNDGNAVGDVFLVDRGEAIADLSVRRSGEVRWSGEGTVHPGIPQRASATLAAGEFTSFEVRLVNGDANERDFQVRADAPTTEGLGATVRVLAVAGGDDLTSRVTGDGWTTGLLKPGSNVVLRVEMRQPLGGPITARRDFRLVASAPESGIASDAVVVVAESQAIPPWLTMISRGADGVPASRNAEAPVVSGDGRYVAFSSDSDSLESRSDTNFVCDIFFWDRGVGALRRVSDASPSNQADADSRYPSISDDGRTVAFQSRATNLVPSDSNEVEDVFVRDLVSGVTLRVSASMDGVQGNRGSDGIFLAGEGRFAVFTSFATNLVPGDGNAAQDVFLRDLQSGSLECISRSAAGVFGDADSDASAITPDGRFILFQSYAANLGPRDANGTSDVYLWDRAARSMELISVNTNGLAGNGASGGGSVSDDGRWVTFFSYASDLAPGASFQDSAAYLYDRQTRSMQRVDTLVNGLPEGMEVRRAAISRNGLRLALAVASKCGSSAVPSQVYLYDRPRQLVAPVSATTAGALGDDHSFAGRWSVDGRYLTLESHAFNLIGERARSAGQVMLADVSQPAVDALVQRSPSATWRGQGVLGETGQVLVQPVAPGAAGERRFALLLRNTGTDLDRFRVRGVISAAAGVTVVAAMTTPSAATITAPLLGGGWDTPVVAPGAEVRLEITIGLSTAASEEVSLGLSIASVSNPSRADAVRLVAQIDQDADGLPDMWERQWMSQLVSMDPRSDDDADGVTALDEWVAGTNPSDGGSEPQFTTVMASSDGGVELGWAGLANRFYTVERGELPGLRFTPVSSAPMAGRNGPMTWRDPLGLAADGAVYRLRIELP